MFRDPVLRASLAMSTLVSTVMMATLVVGPFYLAQGLGLETALVGLALSAGPLAAALTGVPAGRMVDRFGAQRMAIVGLVGMAAGSFVLSTLGARFGLVGYIAPIVIVTASYALFQAANNTVIMTGIRPEQRGVISGMLSLSRNLGLITGHRSWAPCLRSHQQRPTSQRRVPRPSPPACGSHSQLRRF